MWRLAFAAALLPCLLTALYVFLFAVPMYLSETRFAVRGGDGQAGAMPGNVISAGNPGMAMGIFVDGYAVRDYLKSRDALAVLTEKLDFAALMAKGNSDPVLGLPSKPGPDALFAVYKSMVQPRYNMIEQIVVVDVFAFAPQDTVAIANVLLAISDTFVDQLNRKGLEDAVRVAQDEATAAERKAIEARAAMARWRSENENIDPTGDVAMMNTLVTQLEQQLVTAEADLTLIRSLGDANHPRRRVAEQQVASIKAKIDSTRKRLVGSSSLTTSLIAQFEGIKAAREFAEQNLLQSRQTLEQARTTLMRQQRYVSVIAKPKEQETPSYPDKSFMLGASLLLGLTVTFFLSLFFSVRRSFG